ncbi:murein biosynthesis integral membrane protein MurJ [Actinomyces sp. Marseille-P3109]|uniref:murein biosynthesis integral membrane protein MurJ n=1 Tax=Actinomyces sp. Marseille-P3109 TaxID=2083009 RepID=UPI000D54D691|nr:lipid II flippase MurJ [Actinomyces sp. Marseille-P3109]
MALQQRRGGLLSVAGGVAGLTLVSRVLGFLRWLVQAATVGTGTVAGAYTTANQLPNTLYEVVVGGVLAATVVPLLAAPIAAGRREEVTVTASGLLGLVLAVLTPLSLILIVFAAPIAAFLPTSQGVDPALQHELVASFLRMFALQVPMYGVAVVLTGVLQAHNRFTWPALTPMLSSLVVMATYGLYGVLADGADATASGPALQVLGWGTTLGVAALSLPLLWPVHQLGLGLRPTLRLGGAQARRALRLGGAGVWTILAQQLSVLVVLALARWGGQTGTAAVYQYTQAVYVLPYAVLAVPVATVLYPRLTAAFDAHARQQKSSSADEVVNALVATSTALVTAVAVAGTAILLAASDAAERFFSFKQVDGMGQALAVLAPGLIGYALIYQVTRVLFAADRSRPAAHATAAGWLTVALASAACVRLMAPSGGDGRATLVALGAGTTVGMTVAGVSLLAVLARVMGGRVLRPVLTTLVTGLPVALATGLAVRVATTHVASLTLAVLTAVLGATAAAVTVLAAIHLADRSLLRTVRGAQRTATNTEKDPEKGAKKDEDDKEST